VLALLDAAVLARALDVEHDDVRRHAATDRVGGLLRERPGLSLVGALEDVERPDLRGRRRDVGREAEPDRSERDLVAAVEDGLVNALSVDDDPGAREIEDRELLVLAEDPAVARAHARVVQPDRRARRAPDVERHAVLERKLGTDTPAACND